MGPCHTCPRSLGPNSKTHFPTKTGPPPSSFFLLGWPGCHSNRPGRSCLSTLQVPRARIPQWPHTQAFHDCSDHLSTASTAPPPPVSRHLCGRLLTRASQLGIPFLFHVPSSAHSRLKSHDIPLMFRRTPNLEPTIWRRGRLSSGEYKKTSSPLGLNQPGTLPTPWMGQLPSLNYISHQVASTWWEM
jgi:hypothetical protein